MESSIYKKAETMPRPIEEPTLNFNMEKLGNNDLALLVVNKLGLHVKAIEDITYDQVKDTDLGTVAGVGGAGYGNTKVSLDDVMNQKGVFTSHVIMVGDLRVYPNHEEVMDKAYQAKDNIMATDPFQSIGSIFDQVTSGMKNAQAETFVLKNEKSGIAYKFPKRFAEGFYHLATHLEKVLFEGQLMDRVREKNFSQATIDSLMGKKSDAPTVRHEVSDYLLSLEQK